MAGIHHKFAIRNANVFNGEVFQKRTILVEGGRISGDKPAQEVEGVTVIDGAGKFLVPGFIDCHVHLSNLEDVLSKLATSGVTTALDMACWPQSVVNGHRNKKGFADIRSAGPPATCPGSTHSKIPGLDSYLISKPEEAADWVSARVDEGSDYIKIVADSPNGPSQEILNALVSQAHSHGKFVVAHAARKRAFEMALESAADVITHVPLDSALSPETVLRMLNDGRISVPTLSMMEAMSAKFGPPMSYNPGHQSVKAIYEAGVPILAGTDANFSAGSPCPVPHGESLHHELGLLVAAGLTNTDALRAATVLAAKHFGLDDRGTIEEGKRADLVLLAGNPLEDISETKNIERIWIEGVEIQRS